MELGWKLVRQVKSNAIVISNKDSTIGIGSGQPSRLDSCEIAINKMKRLIILALFAGLTLTNKSQTKDGMYAKIKTTKGYNCETK